MNIEQLANVISSATDVDAQIRIDPGKDVVIKASDGVWLELDHVGVTFVNGRFVLQLTAGDRDGVSGMHW